MITSIQFRGFRVLEQATLPLGAFNLLLGPNGSGKTTAIRALLALGEAARAVERGQPAPVHGDLARAETEFEFGGDLAGARVVLRFDEHGHAVTQFSGAEAMATRVRAWCARICAYMLDPAGLARSCARDATAELAPDGSGLAAVLTTLRRQDPTRWTEYLAHVRRLLPEIEDVIAGETVDGRLAYSVIRHDGLKLDPRNLSQGMLIILGLLALAFAPERPSFICLEELERGIHPRLLRDVRDTLYRLSFPQDWNDAAPAVQVLTTTHSPYVLDLFVDTPEDVVLATRDDGGAVFRRLVDIPELGEIVQSGRLGDLWYSGILGGVP